MELEKIKKELENNNYLSFIRDINTQNEFILGGIKDDVTLLKADKSFNIYITDGKIKIQYFEGHNVKEKFFSETKSLITFIKKKFPH